MAKQTPPSGNSAPLDKTDTATAATARSGSTCPICKQPTQKAFRPFCSKRCADIDLSRWLNGHYAIPVVEEDGGYSGNDLED